MSTKNVFYCKGDEAPHEGVAFSDARPKRNCPECKKPMLITGYFEDTEEEVILPNPDEE